MEKLPNKTEILQKRIEIFQKGIEILQAYKDGKTIEMAETYTNFDGATHWSSWSKVRHFEQLCHLTDCDGYAYKIVEDKADKEQEYKEFRPYTNVKEFLNDSKEHGPYIRPRVCDNHYITVNDINEGGISTIYQLTERKYSWDDLVHNFKWQDGSPCAFTVR